MRKSILVAVDSFHMSAKYKVMRKSTSKLMVRPEHLWILDPGRMLCLELHESVAERYMK